MEYEEAMNHLQADIDMLENEKKDLRENLKRQSTKKTDSKPAVIGRLMTSLVQEANLLQFSLFIFVSCRDRCQHTIRRSRVVTAKEGIQR